MKLNLLNKISRFVQDYLVCGGREGLGRPASSAEFIVIWVCIESIKRLYNV